MQETESLSPSSERTWTAILRDLMIGASIGLGIALFWVLLVLLLVMLGLDKIDLSVSRPIKLLVLFVLLVAVVVGGGFVGHAVGGDEGAFWGCCAAYLLAFAGYGVWMQLTTGWLQWVTGLITDVEAKQETDRTKAEKKDSQDPKEAKRDQQDLP